MQWPSVLQTRGGVARRAAPVPSPPPVSVVSLRSTTSPSVADGTGAGSPETTLAPGRDHSYTTSVDFSHPWLGFIVIPYWLTQEVAMGTNITVKGIPDKVYRRLRAAAEANHRSINHEIINRIEQSLMPQRVPTADLLARVRRLHASFGDRTLEIEVLDEARRVGRP